MPVVFSQSLTQRISYWTAWKALLAARNGVCQYDDDGIHYSIWFYDGPEIYLCQIWKGTVPDDFSGDYSQTQNDSDKTDFETNFKPTANASIEPKTKDGRVSVKDSTANRCNNFNLRVFSFYTADPTKVHNVSPLTNADIGDVAYTMYDNTNTVTTTPSAAVKTVIDFMPHYNYEIVGAFADLPPSLAGGTTDAWYMGGIGVPDIPAVAGGSIAYLTETNLEAIAASGRFHSDGRAVSYLPYNYGGYPTNKLRFIIKHPAGASLRFQLYIEHFV